MNPASSQVRITTPWGWNAWKLRQHRIVTIGGEIESTATETLQESLVALTLEGDQPISILLQSPGGDVLEGLGMFDAIQSVSEQGIHVSIYVMGPVASMAAIILQAADHRVMSPNSRMLLHEVREFSFMSQSTVSDAVEKAKELARINDRLADLVAFRTGGKQTQDSIKELWQRDCWMWPEKAKEMGLIDEIALVNFK